MLAKLLHAFPSKLPATKLEFDLFCKDIFKTWGFPDKPGYRQMVASMIQHFDQTTVKASKRTMAKAIRKAQCNELAFYMMKEANEQIKAEEEPKTEATDQENISDQAPTDCI